MSVRQGNNIIAGSSGAGGGLVSTSVKSTVSGYGFLFDYPENYTGLVIIQMYNWLIYAVIVNGVHSWVLAKTVSNGGWSSNFYTYGGRTGDSKNSFGLPVVQKGTITIWHDGQITPNVRAFSSEPANLSVKVLVDCQMATNRLVNSSPISVATISTLLPQSGEPKAGFYQAVSKSIMPTLDTYQIIALGGEYRGNYIYLAINTTNQDTYIGYGTQASQTITWGKLTGDSGPSIIEKQDPTAENNYTWYRKYSDGWVEQGGRMVVPVIQQNATTNVYVALPIEMSQYYSIVAFPSQDNGNSWTLRCYATDGSTSTTVVFGMASKDTLLGNALWFWEVKGMAA